MNRNWWQKKYLSNLSTLADSNNDGIGDLQGIIQKLDYLENLGITLIWLSPMYPSPMADNGYDISDYYGISSDFGTMADFDELIEAKKRNIKVILDLVVNHTSDEHAWFQDVLKNPQSRFRDFYIIKKDEKHLQIGGLTSVVVFGKNYLGKMYTTFMPFIKTAGFKLGKS